MDKDGFILLENYIELRNENKDIEKILTSEKIDSISSFQGRDSEYKIPDALFEELYDEKISTDKSPKRDTIINTIKSYCLLVYPLAICILAFLLFVK